MKLLPNYYKTTAITTTKLLPNYYQTTAKLLPNYYQNYCKTYYQTIRCQTTVPNYCQTTAKHTNRTTVKLLPNYCKTTYQTTVNLLPVECTVINTAVRYGGNAVLKSNYWSKILRTNELYLYTAQPLHRLIVHGYKFTPGPEFGRKMWYRLSICNVEL